MREPLSSLSNKQLRFIKDEFGYSDEQLEQMDEEAIDALYDRVCDIEVETTIEAGEGKLSKRGKMSESIVTFIGNYYHKRDFATGRICPVCGNHTFEEDDNFETCPMCGWVDDLVQRDNPDYEDGANDISLNQYIKRYREELESVEE